MKNCCPYSGIRGCILDSAKRGREVKFLMKRTIKDELWRFVDAQNLPAELEKIVRIGRAENLELLTSTQFPRDYHRSIRSAVTEWVCFSTEEPAELDAVRPYFAKVDKVAHLPLGSFIAYNRDSGAELAGKIF